MKIFLFLLTSIVAMGSFIGGWVISNLLEPDASLLLKIFFTGWFCFFVCILYLSILTLLGWNLNEQH